MRPTVLGFDADDTLWHNETAFNLTHARLADLLKDYVEPDVLRARLETVEIRNLRHYGYGVKSFTLSMIETAVELTRGAAPSRVVGDILALGRDMLASPVEPMDGVRETLEQLRSDHRLAVITKGDLLDQESKLARSGLGPLFDAVEIVSEKTPETYRRVFADLGAGEGRAVMVGNSVRSDVLPAIEAGYHAVWAPYHTTWAHERAEPPTGSDRFGVIERFDQLPAWLDRRFGPPSGSQRRERDPG